jgi:uncharacterized protein (TIGR02271 family)
MVTLQKDRILEFRGEQLCDRSGDKIGSIDEIYLDTETNEPEWALVNTGLFGSKSTFVPLRDATEADGALRVAFDKDTVKDAPNLDPNGQLSQHEEADLYRYYGIDYAESGSDTGLPEGTVGGRFEREGVTGDDTARRTTDDAMTRSEEELSVGTTERETGRVRLKKYVVTEQVQQTVPVRREEVRVEREPITDANVDDATAGPEITEDEHEVTLRHEEPVVEKRTVPKERVRLEKDVVTDDEQVSDELRKEQVEYEEDR